MNLLIELYGLRTLPKKKPVISSDDLYLLLYTHWVLDTATYTDEHQRVTVATGILAAVFFGSRPCSLFDTRVKFEKFDDADDPPETVAVAKATKSGQDLDEVRYDGGHRRQRRRGGNTIAAVDSGCDVDSNNSTTSDKTRENDNDSDSENENDNDSDSDNDGDSDSDNGSDSDDGYWSGSDDDGESTTDGEDLDTDDECDAGPEVTRSFLYRHFTIVIVANETPGKPNIVFMKATLLHTNGEDNHPPV